MRSILPLAYFPSVTFETVSVFVLLTMTLSGLFKKDCLALPQSMPLSSRRPMVWCRWLCART